MSDEGPTRRDEATDAEGSANSHGVVEPGLIDSMLDRARREAMLRMIEDARRDGYDAVFNVRLETSRLANSRGDGKGTAGVEMLAFGTAVKFASRFARTP